MREQLRQCSHPKAQTGYKHVFSREIMNSNKNRGRLIEGAFNRSNTVLYYTKLTGGLFDAP